MRFGTDGWRGVIAEDFTFTNIRRVANAIARYFVECEDTRTGVVVGYDTRFHSPEAAATVADVLSSVGMPVYLADAVTPTPALSFAVRHRGTAGGVMVTASHNPPRWNGLKLKARYAGSASPRMVAEVERFLAQDTTRSLPPQPRRIERVDLKSPYLARLRELVEFDRIARAGCRFVLDPMYGAGAGYLRELLQEQGIPYQEIHGRRDPLFGGLQPEPIPPHLDELGEAVRRKGFDAGLAQDGDADRVGAVDAEGRFVDPHRIFSLVLEHLLARGERGEIARTFSATTMVDRIGERYALPVHVTPIGFKYICDLMLERNLLIGGEESGGIGLRWHLPERDGLLISLLLAEIMATRGKALAALVAELHASYGPHHFARVDLELTAAEMKRALGRLEGNRLRQLGPWTVVKREDLDGIKFHLREAGWVLVRPSGTEPLLRLYAETPSPELTRKVLSAVERLVRRG
ncbi:MAG: phosphoglucomutase/phosphomannomutase family protein [Acidobacteria bacterium]|nr:phosphoglucomutase/phosphomannomutase family protein [Acidobacteriota bacterium]